MGCWSLTLGPAARPDICRGYSAELRRSRGEVLRMNRLRTLFAAAMAMLALCIGILAVFDVFTRRPDPFLQASHHFSATPWQGSIGTWMYDVTMQWDIVHLEVVRPIADSENTSVGFIMHRWSLFSLGSARVVGQHYWIRLPTILLIAILLSPLMYELWRGPMRRRRRLRLGQCVGCGYPLTGLPEPRCPECGRPADPSALPDHAR